MVNRKTRGRCYAFFSRTAVQVSAHIQEYLLAKNFEIVFEGIINTLIGDNDVPDKLINQRDGKIVDHIFTHRGLTTHERDKKVYYRQEGLLYRRLKILQDWQPGIKRVSV